MNEAPNDEIIAKLVKHANRVVWYSSSFLFACLLFLIFHGLFPDWSEPEQVLSEESEPEIDRDLIVDGIHVRTGLIEADGMYVVIGNCTNCHSGKLITQNRMSEARWNETINWMQETQGLWDLGENRKIIIDYLVTNYPVAKSNGRRANLTDIEWYEEN